MLSSDAIHAIVDELKKRTCLDLGVFNYVTYWGVHSTHQKVICEVRDSFFKVRNRANTQWVEIPLGVPTALDELTKVILIYHHEH